jgi:hypothetical protein
MKQKLKQHLPAVLNRVKECIWKPRVLPFVDIMPEEETLAEHSSSSISTIRFYIDNTSSSVVEVEHSRDTLVQDVAQNFFAKHGEPEHFYIEDPTGDLFKAPYSGDTLVRDVSADFFEERGWPTRDHSKSPQLERLRGDLTLRQASIQVVERIDPENPEKVERLNNNATLSQAGIQNGDRLRVFLLSVPYEGSVKGSANEGTERETFGSITSTVITGLVSLMTAYMKYRVEKAKIEQEGKSAPSPSDEAQKGEQVATVVETGVQQYSYVNEMQALAEFQHNPQMSGKELEQVIRNLAQREPAFTQQLQRVFEQTSLSSNQSRRGLGHVNVIYDGTEQVRQNFGNPPNLSNQNFVDVQFVDIDLSHANVHGAYFHNVQFIRCNLTGVDFDQATMAEVQFIDTDVDLDDEKK